jgi:hypothetical protein
LERTWTKESWELPSVVSPYQEEVWNFDVFADDTGLSRWRRGLVGNEKLRVEVFPLVWASEFEQSVGEDAKLESECEENHKSKHTKLFLSKAVRSGDLGASIGGFCQKRISYALSFFKDG